MRDSSGWKRALLPQRWRLLTRLRIAIRSETQRQRFGFLQPFQLLAKRELLVQQPIQLPTPCEVPHFQSRFIGSAVFTGFSAILLHLLSPTRGSVPDPKPPLTAKPTQQA